MSLLLVPFSPQRGLIYLLVALAETAWLAAVTISLASSIPIWFFTLFILVAVAILLGWVAEAYGIPLGLARFVGLGLVLLGFLLLSKLSLYPLIPFWSFDWLGHFLRSLIVNPAPIATAAIFSILLVGYIWWRCLPVGQTLPDLTVTTFTAQIGFLGLVVALILNAFGLPISPPLGFVILFAVASLMALSLSYTQTIALHHGPGFAGRLGLRVSNAIGAIGLVGLAALLLSLVFSFSTVQAVFTIVLQIIDLLLTPVLAVLVWFITLIGPWLDALFNLLLSMVPEGAGLELVQADVTPTPEPLPREAEAGPVWWGPYLLWGWRVLVIVLIGWAFYRLLGRWYRQQAAVEQISGNQTEVTVAPAGSGFGDLWSAGKERVTDLFNLVRRFGLGQDLRAAVTIRRIYAALMALAEQQGFERAPAQTPLEFLEPLEAAWPGISRQLGLITQAYVNVHYGQIPEGEAGLQTVQAAWQEVIQFSQEPP
jgi:hypothetical protein